MPYLTMKGRFEHSIMPVIAVFILLSVDFTESKFITSPIAYHIASFVDVSVSDTCTSDHNGNSCNDTCPSRTDFPSIADTPLTSKDSSCGAASSTAGLANQTNGNINFKNGTNCTSVNTTVAISASGSFTFSIWLTIMASYESMLFSIGDQFSVTIDHSVLVVKGKPIGKLKADTWIHLALRFQNNGNLDVFINGQRFSNYTTPVNGILTQYQLVIGPNKDLATSKILDMADARWYQDVLTDREIEFLATGNFSKLAVDSECRCPDTHPILHKTSGDTRQRHLFCEDRHGAITRRLNNDAHPGVYILDGDNNTYWNSGTVNRTKITVALGTKLQLKTLILYGLQPNRETLIVTLNGKNFTAQLNGNYTAIDFEGQFSPVENRTVYEKLLTDTVEISLEHSSATNFTVSEVEIHARCPCYGNDDSCSINSSSLDYSCSCNTSSHTIEPFCESCENEFYRKMEDTVCQYPCACHPNGSKDNICSEIGGQCICKSNVDNSTRACDRCNFNTVNITSDVDKGCTECACNPIGIRTCMNDLTCVCKANVESDSGQCEQCLPNYYGIENETGCSPCDCHKLGTNETDPHTCNMSSGQCPCKRDVTGRTCNTCKDEYFNLDIKNTYGCESCDCNIVGRTNNKCDKETGQCVCRQPVTGNINCKPANLQLKPDYGPVSGGTKITVTGELLGDNTVDVRLTLSEKLDVEKNDTVIVTRTKRNAAVEEVPLTIVWSKGGVSYESAGVNMKFTFKEDPTVTVPKDVVKTFASGGCAVDIFGENLDNVPEPELFIYTSNQNLSTSCSHVGSSQITCQTPNLAAVISDGEVTYGIGLDNIHDYNKFATSQTSIRIEPDPNVTMGEMIEFRNSFDDTITIKGTGLNTACRDSDVRILIDNGMCSLLSRTDTEITCDPEESFPGTSREATVMLYIGDMEVEVGKVTFISFWNTTEFYIIVGCVGGGILMIIAIIIAFCLCRRRRRQKINESIKRSSEIELTTAPNRRSNAYVTMESPAGSSSNPVAMVAPLQGTTTPVDHAKAFIKRLPTNVAKTVKTSIVDKSQIELGRMCTQKGGLVRIINGQFGSTSSSLFAGTNLTIKTLIDRYDAEGSLPSWLADGLLECTRLRDCYNTNVLPLLGISIDDKHVYILYPEMSNRSLKDYMNNASRAFNQEKRLNICIQVAEGMNFLDAEHIVHKDLATRNCWVESNDMVKIGDAAFSWDLYPDEYSLQNDRYQPVRWMAPESLRQPGFYNSKTDVWSYGVFMWEVFTNGHLPYHDIEDDTQIKEYVCEAGYRLGKPHECTDIIYQVIEICHGDNSQGRPNFFIILNHLTEIMAGGNPTISYVNQQNFTSDEVDYMNFGELNGMAH